jgi:hypothetical protein
MRNRFVLVLLLTAGGAGLFGQGRDARTYDQVAKTANKTVADLFLLCPRIVFMGRAGEPASEIAFAKEDDKLDASGKGFQFRKSLLMTGRSEGHVAVTSALVDLKNAYIRIDGTDDSDHGFSLVFVYFDRADGSHIPALTYDYWGLGTHTAMHRFFDVHGSNWKAMADEELFSPITEKPLIPYAGQGDASNTDWQLELPQYGTTVRFLPTRLVLAPMADKDKEENTASYLAVLSHFVLECAWDTARGRFKDPVPALADKSDVRPKATAADVFTVLPLPFENDMGLDTATRRAARDKWKAGAGIASFFDWGMDVDKGYGAVSLKSLGQYRGLPLFALAAEFGAPDHYYAFFLLAYHADSGLGEIVSTPEVDIREFYKAARKAKMPRALTEGHHQMRYSVDAEKEGFIVLLDDVHDQDVVEYPPDYALRFLWDGASSTFVRNQVSEQGG